MTIDATLAEQGDLWTSPTNYLFGCLWGKITCFFMERTYVKSGSLIVIQKVGIFAKRWFVDRDWCIDSCISCIIYYFHTVSIFRHLNNVYPLVFREGNRHSQNKWIKNIFALFWDWSVDRKLNYELMGGCFIPIPEAYTVATRVPNLMSRIIWKPTGIPNFNKLIQIGCFRK